MHIKGSTKYSKEKLVALALCNSLTGYSIKPASTTAKPSIHAGSCVNKKMNEASRNLFFGMNQRDIKQISHTIPIISLSIRYIYLIPPSLYLNDRTISYIENMRGIEEKIQSINKQDF
jgi:hypothetical protein